MIDIPDFLDQLILTALNAQVSDIHVQPYAHEYRIRFRCDGLLEEVQSCDTLRALQLCARIKVLAQLDVAEKRRPQDGAFLFRNSSYDCDVRVALFPSLYGEKVVLRLLERTSKPKTLNQLGLHPRVQDMLRACAVQDTGSIMFTGPTGSGKTTTAHALISSLLNDSKKNIVTLEDPIEYLIPGATQTAVHPGLGLSFEMGLRALLRQDPDVIMVGEMRDGETARVALQAALTGHLVITTLHTNDAPSALVRLVHLGCEPYAIADAVKVIVAQRLVQTICMICKRRTPLLSHEKLLLRSYGYDRDEVFQGVGCAQCRGTGLHGRIGIFQALEMSNTIRAALINREYHLIAVHNQREEQMPLIDDAYAKLSKGIIPFSEWARCISVANNLERAS